MKKILSTSLFYSILLLIFLTTPIYSLESSPTVSIKTLRKTLPEIKYLKVHDRITLHFEPFPISSSQAATWPHPIIPETFIATIPKGRVYSKNGYIIVKGQLLQELIWPWSPIKKDPTSLKIDSLPNLQHIQGKVAVITQEGHLNYYHWMTEIIPKIALLKSKNIEYDWLYVPRLDLPFMKETLNLLGIDPAKILEAHKNTYIEADELIVPSFASRSCFSPPWIVDFLRDQFLSAGNTVDTKVAPAKRIYISRSLASARRILNENEVFSMLAAHEFKKYNLEELSFAEQIALFKNAEVIVAPHGAGLTNLLFCKPGTKVIEIIQHHEDDTYWYLSQILKLKHICISTATFDKKKAANDTIVPPALIEKHIKS